MNPVLSIIIPVYKVEAYLPCCLDSLVNQSTSYPYEVILVDDGSPDGSGAICDDYAARHPFISAHHQGNSGPSAARNLGLEHARGSLVSFVDSDDWVSPLYVETLVSEMGGNDLMFFGFRAALPNDVCDVVPSELGTFLSSDSIERTLSGLLKTVRFGSFTCRIFGHTWIKVFRHEIINRLSLRFASDISVCEDELFTLAYCTACNSLRVIPDVIYSYRILPSGLLHSKHSRREYVVLYLAELKLREAFKTAELRNVITFVCISYVVNAALYRQNSLPTTVHDALLARSLYLQLPAGTALNGRRTTKLLVHSSYLATVVSAAFCWLVKKVSGDRLIH